MAWTLNTDLNAEWAGYVFNGNEDDPEHLLNNHSYNLAYIGYGVDIQTGELGHIWKYQTDYLRITYVSFPSYDCTGLGNPTDPSTILVVASSQIGNPGTYYVGLFVMGITSEWAVTFDSIANPGWGCTGTATVSQVPNSSGIFTPAPLVPDRPVDYDPDLRWDEETGTWLDIPAAGGGAYKDQLVLVGNGGEIYIGDT